MKWGEYNDQVAERVTGWFSKKIGARVLYIFGDSQRLRAHERCS